MRTLLGMATKTTVKMTDDLDPEQMADEAVWFCLDGVSYEVDLSAEHADQLRDRLATYVGAARKAGGARPVRRAPRTSGTPGTPIAGPAPGTGPAAVDSKAVREWAKANGKPVNERGDDGRVARLLRRYSPAFRRHPISVIMSD